MFMLIVIFSKINKSFSKFLNSNVDIMASMSFNDITKQFTKSLNSGS